MNENRFIQRLSLQNFLSYGEVSVSLDMLPLNVLIGPNGSGKSNLIEALSILRSTPTDISSAIREGGGIAEYIHKRANPGTPAEIKVISTYATQLNAPLYHSLSLTRFEHAPEVLVELIGRSSDGVQLDSDSAVYGFAGRTGYIVQRTAGAGEERITRVLRESDVSHTQSILSQRRDPDLYPELTWLGDRYGRVTIFRDWTFGQRAKVRLPEPADLPTDFLLPDSSNLALVLHEMQQRAPVRKKLLEYLQRFYSAAQHISTRIQGGTVQLYIDEGMDELVPATRLSDGTLRYLSLLAILLHPTPPPLVCIEEPELGLHPDILPTIGELLIDASQRTQLVVTTHSDALVSALSEVPESIVVCEPSVHGTQLRRLDREALSEWLDRYSLGEIWRMGEIGGTRW